MIAGSITSCSNDSDDIIVEKTETKTIVENITKPVTLYDNIVYSTENQLLGVITGQKSQNPAVEVLSSHAVTYKSSNESIATVDEQGFVTAKGQGDVTITAVIGDEKTIEVPVFCFAPKVILDDKPMAVSSVTIPAPDDIRLTLEDNTFLLISHENGKVETISINNTNRLLFGPDDPSSITFDEKTGKTILDIDFDDGATKLSIKETIAETYNTLLL